MQSKVGPAWFLLAVILLSFKLGGHALVEPDEGRNAVVAQEMAASGEFLFPRLDGLPYLDKPFLYFALGALSIRAFGSTEFAVRLPSLLFAWGTIALTAWFSSLLFGRRTAWVAGLACATSLHMILLARIVIFDSVLSFFVVAALIALYQAIEEERAHWTLLGWVAMALGVFTKGPVALLLPLMVAVPYAFWRRRPRALFCLAGWPAFVLLITPWLIVSERGVPGFLRYALVTETWQRMTTDAMARNKPAWYLLAVLFLGTFPWILLAAASLRRWLREVKTEPNRGPLVYLLLWMFLPLVFFSLSHSKQIPYVLPLVPAIALLTAWSWSGESERWPGVRAAAAGWVLISAVFLSIWGGLGAERLAGGFSTSVPQVSLRLALVALAAAIGGFLSARHRAFAPIALSLPLVFFLPLIKPVENVVAEERSGRAMALAAADILEPETAILGIEAFYPSLAFYLGRPIQLASATGDPSRSNYIEFAYDSLLGTGFPPMVAADTWRGRVEECSRPILILIRSNRGSQRSELEALGLPLVFANDNFLLFGPCRPPNSVARGPEQR